MASKLRQCRRNPAFGLGLSHMVCHPVRPHTGLRHPTMQGGPAVQMLNARILQAALFTLTSLLAAQELPKKGTEMNAQGSPHANAETAHGKGARTHAVARITVHSSQATPFDTGLGSAVIQLSLGETFDGDIAGESTAHALEVRHGNGGATMVSMQRFSGKLGGRQGAFVLQGSETVENGKIKATWFVVPGSGTGDLSGLLGEGGFEGEFGKGSIGTLDYWFE
jgi:hypothetical protein